MEEALYEVASLQVFSGLVLRAILDETAILNFRHISDVLSVRILNDVFHNLLVLFESYKSGGIKMPMTARERAAYRNHIFRMGIRDVPVENNNGYHEHRSTIPSRARASYPHGSPSAGPTPAHITDMRRDAVAQAYVQHVVPTPGMPSVPHVGQPFTIHGRFHQHIDPATGAIGAPILDRHRATAPNNQGGYDVFAAIVNHGTRTVTIHNGGGVVEPPISPRTQGR